MTLRHDGQRMVLFVVVLILGGGTQLMVCYLC